ncbi:TetR/AcrR family transcriptional regulator [Mycobacteroides immunogenum]|uniref:TetR family transcriptional regulator n=1 Tax=Mycobacteroides immunogenum TaxID=83262 RepID=A0A7V8LUJ1_9MYCO|nr:TetR/AcrR family transcriptional regulator [Mycobacteroides immunogenum]AMT73427.1 TetR family transcriptional regulator [Mycobacteroides immunogenum]ANO06593.1 TetR family transcriptional regulator [Mycobacteroides immunogenum]KIU39929.1 TetR family transcriptional regulator [Mycobacteroides immunogenum]KPG10931.1 TetR family transcriptional regulator [Mycobacteroides immunogenum]KPG13067.1 TetR family transcriptional regulator [Mycobacteroides immunogenum]
MAKAVAQRGFARERVLEAALALFRENGVNGTSLQMIADRLGVNKSAVYYQFHSKDDIVLEIVRPVFDDTNRVVRIANALSTPAAKREAAVSGLVEMSVRHRTITSLFFDPVAERAARAHEEFMNTYDDLTALLQGPNPGPADRVAMSVLMNGLLAGAADPDIADVPDAALHDILLDCARRLLDVAAAPVI